MQKPWICAWIDLSGTKGILYTSRHVSPLSKILGNGGAGLRFSPAKSLHGTAWSTLDPVFRLVERTCLAFLTLPQNMQPQKDYKLCTGQPNGPVACSCKPE